MNEVPESCTNCIYALGPATMPVLRCINPVSEFANGPVAHDGYCPEFKPPSEKESQRQGDR